MKKIVIVAADNAVASNITGVLDFFWFCNTFWHASNEDEVTDLFECKLVSPLGSAITTSLSIVIPAHSPDIIDSADALIISSAHVHNQVGFKAYLEKMSPLFEQIKGFHEQQKPIGAFCSGTFVLAATGLLDNKSATCAWWLTDLFKRSYPKVNLSLDSLVIEQDNLYTGGATTAYLSLCLKLVEEMAGEYVANQMARIMLVDPNRASQLPFMSLQQLSGHKDDRVNKIQQWMQANLTESFSLDDLADRFALSKRTLIRRFKKAVGDTPVNYLQRLRVEEAKRLLETTPAPLEDIVARVGYGDVSTFRKLFQQLTQLSPKAYRLRFNLAFA
ncbi:MAG: helix-turn-helix domain-containing protein [Algicola sp.]|nr:helix-turn-helix domain-containing protein [Algicola sp.]